MLGIEHSVHAVDVDEVVCSTGVETAVTNARIKLKKARAELEALEFAVEATVLAFDTVVELEDQVFGKPESLEDAVAMLRTMSGKTHVVTGAMSSSRVDGSSAFSDFCQTEVAFMELSNEIIDWYIETDEWKGRAGSYAIQGKGSLLVDSVQGDYQNVVGLPVSLFRNLVLLSDPVF